MASVPNFILYCPLCILLYLFPLQHLIVFLHSVSLVVLIIMCFGGFILSFNQFGVFCMFHVH